MTTNITDDEHGSGEDRTTTLTETPAALENVRDSIVRAFDDALAAGLIGEPEPAATPQESARLLDAAFERFERDHGLNVVPFPERALRTAGQEDGGAA